MASQGPFIVGTGTNIDVGSNDWANPSLITASDGILADGSAPPDAQSDWLAGTNAGFTISVGATIDGIVVELDDLDTGVLPCILYLTKDGSNFVGTSQSPSDGIGWVAYGNATDLWGTTWTRDEINASTFGALLIIQGDEFVGSFAQIDAERITVYYSGGVSSPSIAIPDFSRFPKCRLRRVG